MNHCPPSLRGKLTRRNIWLPAAGMVMLAALFSLGLCQRAGAQTYTLSNAWNVTSVAHVGNNSGLNRGIAYDVISNEVFVANRTSGSSGFIDVFDGTAGTLLSGAGGISGANLGIDQVGVSDDGVLYATPLDTGLNTTTGNLTIYSWTNWFNNGTPYPAYASSSSDAAVVNFPGKRIGDSMTVGGKGLNTLILLGIGGQGTNFILLHTSDGLNFTPTAVLVPTGLPSTAGNIFSMAFYTNNTFLIMEGANASSHNVFLVSYPANFASQSSVVGTVLGNAATFPANLTASISYSPAGKLLAVVQTANVTPNNTNGIFSLTNFPTTASELARVTNATPNANGNATGGAALGGAGKTNFLYSLESNNGVRAYAINYTLAAIAPSISSSPVGISGAYPTYSLSVSASGSVPLNYQWLASNSGTNTLSTFTNIPTATNNSFAITTASTNYYEVIITNLAGSVTSAPVRVALLTPITSTVVTQLWRVAAGTAGYSYLGTDGTTRGMGYDTNSQRLVVANNSGTINVVDANTGTNLGTMNTSSTDFAGGTFNLDQVVIADDGAVYSGNLAISASQTFKLNRWSGPFTNVTSTVAYDDSGPGTLKNGDRWGDTMAVRGSGLNTQILLASRNGTNVALLTTMDGISFSAQIIAVTGVPAAFSGLGIAFGNGNSFWSKTTGGDLRKIAFDPVALTGSVVLDYVTPGQIPSQLTGLGIDPVNNILASVAISDTPNDMQLFQLTGTSDAPVLFDQAFFASANANGNGSVAIAMKYPRVYGLDANNGLLALTYGIPPTTAPTINTQPASQTSYAGVSAVTFGVGVSGSLPLFYQWRFNSNTIAGATSSSYTITNPASGTAGYYDVVVHNIAGSVTSSPALLTIIIPVTSSSVKQIWAIGAGTNGSYLTSSGYETRGLAYDPYQTNVLVADHFNIYIYNATNGTYVGQVNTTGLATGLNGWTVDQIGVSDSGTLYSCNLSGDGLGFDIETYANNGPGGGYSISASYSYGPGNDLSVLSPGDRWGDTMAVRGSGLNTQFLFGSYNGTNVALFTTTDGGSFTPEIIAVQGGVPAGFAGEGIAFGPGNTFYAKGGHNYNLRQVSFSPGSGVGNVVQNYLAGTDVPNDLAGLGVDITNSILGGVCYNDSPHDVQLYVLSGNTNPPVLFNQEFFPTKNDNVQENAVVTLYGGVGFALDVNNGVVGFTYSLPALAVKLTTITYAPGNVTLTWINAVSGHTYQVQYKNNLLDATWTNAPTTVMATGTTASYTDTTATGAMRYYRIISL